MENSKKQDSENNIIPPHPQLIPSSPTAFPPERWSATTRGFAGIFTFIIIGLFLYWVRPLLAPVLIAMAAAYGMNPMVKWVKRRTHLNHSMAVSIVYVTTLVAIIVIPSTLTPVIIGQLQNIFDDLTSFEREVESLLAEPTILFGSEIHIGDVVGDIVNSTTNSFSLGAGNALAFLETTSISFAWLLIILVCTYYFLLDSYKLRDWLISLAPTNTQSDVNRLLYEIGIIWQTYIGGTLALIVITATVMTLLYTVLGLAGAVPIGLLTGLLILIPELGVFLSGTLAVLSAFFLGAPNYLPISDVAYAVIIGVTHLILMQIQTSWLQKRLRDRYLHMHGGVVFIAILGALVLQGVLGALIVMPMLATLGKIGHYTRARLFGLEPWGD